VHTRNPKPTHLLQLRHAHTHHTASHFYATRSSANLREILVFFAQTLNPKPEALNPTRSCATLRGILVVFGATFGNYCTVFSVLYLVLYHSLLPPARIYTFFLVLNLVTTVYHSPSSPPHVYKPFFWYVYTPVFWYYIR
jgi:hypothetical protein